MASHIASRESPHPIIDPESTQELRGRKISFMRRSRSSSGLFCVYAGDVGNQK